METNQDAEGLDSKVYGADCVSVLTDDDINEFISTMGGGDIITKDLLVRYLVSVGAESNFSDELASNFLSRLQAENIRKNPDLKPAVMSNQVPLDMMANPNLSNRFGPVTGVDPVSPDTTNIIAPFSDPSSNPSHREIRYGEDTSDLPMYYEATDKVGFKEKLKKPYVWLIVLLCVGALVTLISVFMKKAKKGTYSAGQTMTPSSAPTFLSEDMLQAAIKLSGKDSFASELSPQYRAVSWLSSVDQTTYDTYGPSFKQRYSIIVIYYSLEGENWNQQEDWLNPGKHECDWSASIFCEYNEAEERKFTDFDRSDSNLSGSLPPEIGLLTTAKTFRIHGNNIRGSIPSTIGRLSLLSVLDCNSNKLSGSIPSEIGGATHLIWLDISRNTLESTIPITMFLLSSLRDVNLSWNRISGSLRSEVGNLDSLVTLDLSHNHLTGTIPPELDELPNLSTIRFDYNELGGSLPLVTANFLMREVISLSHNQFTGSFAFHSSVLESQLNPDDEQLHVLDLSYNKLSGPISNVFAHLQRISYIDISENAFAGSIPEMFDWPDLEHLSVASNALSGTFPLGWPKLSKCD
jgi:Leucine Rich Repeat